jgi:16S rRNA C967 or C1407 C5-methylase (RsmB/RsmF family)/NOL1/NOP2/fmu family ribosome biogenesis protein
LELPFEFKQSIRSSLDEDSTNFFDALQSTPPISIRINKNKYNKNFDQCDRITWNECGRYLAERPSFTLDPTFHAGSYYVQEASSMMIGKVILQLNLDQKPIKVLDLCAAPGGKTTLLHDNLHTESLIVANEVIKSRANILRENIIKWGCQNTIITSVDPSQFHKSGLTFDLILVDAPCSGEGMFRKDPESIKEWSVENVEHCSLRQNRILYDIWPCLNEGGYLIYSTCTYNHKENIDQVVNLQKKYNLKSLPLTLEENWGITEIKKDQAYGYQCYPHKTKGEGYFFSVLQKNEPIIQTNVKLPPAKLRLLHPKELSPLVPFVSPHILPSIYQHPNGDCYFLSENIKEYTYIAQSQLNLQYAGVKLGTLNRNLFLPDPALALSHIHNESIPKSDLTYDEAISFLRRTLASIDSQGNGWQIAQYQEFNLGWYKQLGNRINNYFPVEWRVRM